jgi:carbon-monoxide dehydrogenase medium subunit
MIAQEFDYHLPSSIEEAAALLSRLDGDAAVLGGGTMLVPSMSSNRVKVRAVLALTALKLDTVTLENGHLCLGAMTSYATILKSALIAAKAPLLRIMADQITGGPSIQNQGTIGGSASYANPASDAPSCLTALEATFELQSVAGVRMVAACDFFLGAFHTARRPDEFLARIHLPVLTGTLSASYDKHKFCASSWPIVTVACVAHREHAGAETFVHLSVGGAATTPTFQRLSIGADTMRDPERWIDTAANAAVAAIVEGWSDELADARYRIAIVPAVVGRSLRRALKELST